MFSVYLNNIKKLFRKQKTIQSRVGKTKTINTSFNVNQVGIVKIIVLLFSFLFLFGCASAQLDHSQGYQIKPVADGIYRGPRPTAENLQYLKTMGVRSILDLENDSDAISAEKAIAGELGIKFESLPMSEVFAPSPEKILLAVDKLKTLPRPVLVHCRKGHDRTGYVIASYRILEQQWDLNNAFRECLDMGHSPLYDGFPLYWKHSLEKIESEYKTHYSSR